MFRLFLCTSRLGRSIGCGPMSRILVVDDEPRIASFVSRGLEAEGFAVDSASDGRQALRLARKGAYDLMVLDLMLPGLDGVSVLRGTIASRPDQRVLVLSALPDIEAKVKCLELGASDYVCKPFALEELVARVRARLRQPKTPPPERVLRGAGIVLDLRRRVADSGGGCVPLSTREFLLLEHLIRKAGEACSREEILASVWGFAYDPGTNVVDVYVRRLRSKLGPDTIQTVRNVGYCVETA